MEKISEEKHNFSLSVAISTTGQLHGLNLSSFDYIFLGNPFCPRIKDNPISSVENLERAIVNFSAKEKIILNTPICPLEEEISILAEILNKAKSLGIWGVCINNFGFVYWIKQEFPSFKIYFDSLTNVYSLQDAKFIKELGAIGGLLACEVDLTEREYILKHSDLEIITPVAGYIPLTFSRYCFFYPKGLPDSCPNPCRENCILSYPKSGQVKQKGRVIYSGKSLSMLEYIRQLQEKGFRTFRIEGWIMSSEQINETGEMFYRALVENYKSDWEEELYKIFPEGFCNGFFFSGKGRDYYKNNGLFVDKRVI